MDPAARLVARFGRERRFEDAGVHGRGGFEDGAQFPVLQVERGKVGVGETLGVVEDVILEPAA